MAILVVTKTKDTTADFVIKRMIERNLRSIRVNTDSFANESTVAVRFPFDSSIISIGGNRVNIADINSVWFRRFGHPEQTAIRDQEARKFSEQEFEFCLKWMLDSLTCPVIDKEIDTLRARNKFEQLSVAQKIGLEIPKTLITNDPLVAREFIKGIEVSVVKSVGGYGRKVKGGFESVYTNVVTPEILKNLESIRLAPVCIQEKIEKKFELRVTVVDERIFSCRIDSQISERTKVDWRRYDPPKTPHRAWEIGSQIQEKLLAIMKYFKIRFAAFDLIVTPEDRTVFLEMNPSGQFVWIELLTGMPITDTLIDELARR